MPYRVSKSGSCSSDKPYAVIKKDDGKVMGCHASKESAQKQIAAIYASENKEDSMPDEESMEVKSTAISFEEMESQQRAQESAWRVFELTDMFSSMVRNIYEDKTIDTQSALNRLVGEFQQRVEAAMNPNRKEKIPQDLSSISPIEHKEDKNEFLMFKSDEGKWRWFAIYSNMYRDDDHPSEIISSKSHRAFTSLVDKGMVDYPELWQWHIEGSAWGKADWLAYSDGFAMAAGYVYDEFEFAAKSLAAYKGDIRVSHGMPTTTIVRDPDDPSVIIFHVTKEISPLPGWAAANKWTGFTLLKEGDSMPISDDKKEHLRKLGYSDELISQIETGVKSAKEALDGEVESKEAPTAEEEVKTEESEIQAEIDAEDAEEVSDEESEDEMAEFKKEIATAVAEAINPLITALNLQAEHNTQLRKELSEVQKQLTNLQKTDAEKIAETKENTPVRSLGEMIASQIVGSNAARIGANDPLANDGPKEKDAEAPAFTPIPMLNEVIAKQRNGRV